MPSRVAIPVAEQRKVLQRSGNVCAFAGCGVVLTAPATPNDRLATLGEMAHIVGASSDGPRGESPLTDTERNRYENLILLCNTHHQLIDSQPSSFSVEMLQDLKATHEAWVQQTLQSGDAAGAFAPTPTNPYNVLGRTEYLTILMRSCEQRIVARRFGAGLDAEQVQRSLRMRAGVPAVLAELPAGQARVLVGPLGSGKSDTAEAWHRSGIERAVTDTGRAVPLWFTVELLDKSLESQVIDEVGLEVLSSVGVDVVIDGLDERTDRSADAVRQAGAFVTKWNRSRVLLTARAVEGSFAAEVVTAPLLTTVQARRLIGLVAGRQLGPLDSHLQEAIARPLFALLVAVHASAAEGATGIPELVDRVVDSVITREGHDLYLELQHLAVETVRTGKPVDPERFTTADVAARIRQSSLITRTGRTCAFSLATFEQWFAAKAVAEGVADLADEVTTLLEFDRWKYVLAIVLAAAEPLRADRVMAALARWNPGAASWVIRETHTGGLSRSHPDYTAGDWQSVGERLRTAAEAWLEGLGPLAEATYPVSLTRATDLAEITLAVDLRASRVTLAWLLRYEIPTEPLAPVIRANNLGIGSGRSVSLRTHPITTGLNWVWETMQHHLAGDINDRFASTAQQVASRHPGIVLDELRELRNARAPIDLIGGSSSTLYPGPDVAPTYGEPWEPWGSYTAETMLERARQVAAAAMACYLELTDSVTPNFGDTLGVRGLMPVQFFGDVHYSPERGPDDFPGPPEPGLGWVLLPHSSPETDRDHAGNVVSLTLNDEDRNRELSDGYDNLYTGYEQWIEARPEYQDFAPGFSVHSGRFDILVPQPATRMAIHWLWEDLRDLGWITAKFPPRLM